MFGKVRRTEKDVTCTDISNIQLVQNKLLRLMTGNKLQDKISIKCMLESTGMLSVNQMNAECKIKEIWKSLNIKDYPLKVERQMSTENMRVTRAITQERLVEHGKSTISQKHA